MARWIVPRHPAVRRRDAAKTQRSPLENCCFVFPWCYLPVSFCVAHQRIISAFVVFLFFFPLFFLLLMGCCLAHRHKRHGWRKVEGCGVFLGRTSCQEVCADFLDAFAVSFPPLSPSLPPRQEKHTKSKIVALGVVHRHKPVFLYRL